MHVVQVAGALAYGMHILVLMPAAMACSTRRNPCVTTPLMTTITRARTYQSLRRFAYMNKFRPAYWTAWRTGSADAALDETITCAVESQEVRIRTVRSQN